MVFASLEFLAVFLPAFLLLYALTPARAKNTLLLLSSWLFYGWWSPLFLLLFIALTALAWVGGLLVERAQQRRKAVLVALIALNLGVLAWFKYANIVVETFSAAIVHAGAMPLAWQRIALPIGLSFTVLQAISYFVDIYRGRFPAERRPIDFATYLAMFGHLVAGPIIRYDWIRQRLAHRSMRWSGFARGARRFMIGMAMKVLVADTLAPVVDQVFASAEPSFIDAWLGCLAYTLQLFFDFAGYSAMAIGIGAMLGFRFPENFNAPYLARNVAEFWRRWHISLSSWLRDYLYVPLGGSRQGNGRTVTNLMLTMGIGGLWHGADSWNFLYWGLAHGAALSVVHLWRQRGPYLPSLPSPVAHAATLLFVMLGWTLFRSPDLATAGRMLGGQFGLQGLGLGAALSNMLRVPVLLAYALGIAWVIAPAVVARRRHAGAAFALAASLLPIAGFVLAMALVASRGTVPFLYFQF
ncbi:MULTISPECIES: MBOAT family protein [unclassified Variovorax]|uniref:MBOAT family O-acyltransferase n=1 Tax=unclassified Variovorax TaxID=663243 RepID=UPI0008BAC7F4|nr:MULTISPECIES: MBOAT family protein [unclassified Variovorax]SEJ75319.1 alginate O-acetyltransferase complex protein AlgI [Variovorax sp. OK202]SFC88028.1 alginate O-acetyltransferase complex protein AlgI [Variovorax sp. OK212]